MDFFERQDHARRRTRALVFWFCCAVITIIGAVYLVTSFVLGGLGVVPEQALGNLVGPIFWEPRLFLAVTAGVVALVALGSLYKIAMLRQGGESVARMLGGSPVDTNTEDAALRRLLNVVEEMAIASGVPVPPVYLLEREKGINAFAAGSTPGDAVVGVTRGCVELLSRDELQGVIAHEFSHILNGDMRLNLRLIGVLHGILVLALTGWWLIRSLRFASGDRRAGGVLFGVAAVGFVLVIVGWIGVFFGRLIKSAVSRQREYLADASAVQFTRHPPGLAGALKKIGGLGAGSRINDRHAEEASHMFFSNAVGASWARAFSTHPPLLDRIRRLEPRFDGTFPEVQALPGGPFRKVHRRQLAGSGAASEPSASASAASSMAAAALAPAVLAPQSTGSQTSDIEETSARAERLTRRIGTLSREHVDFASRALGELSPELRESAHDPVEAEALVYALLLHQDEEVRQGQLRDLEARLGNRAAATFAEIARARQRIADLQSGESGIRSWRLLLVDLALPALRAFSDRQYRDLRTNVSALATGDVEQRLFEYTLQRILTRHLAPHYDGPEPSRVAYHHLRAVADEAATLLSALAHVGRDGDPESAFAAGSLVLDLPLRLVEPDRCTLAHVDLALRRLAQVSPPLKRKLVEAVAVTTIHDAEVRVEEAELLRAICDALDCPVPPLLPGESL